MRPRILWAFALLLLGVLLVGSNWLGPRAATDFPTRNGHIYTQASTTPGLGFRITDDGATPLWTAFQRLGGVAILGYPISRRFLCEGDICQATENAMLRWQGSGEDGKLVPLEGQDLLAPESAGDRSLLRGEGIRARESGMIPPAALRPEEPQAADLPDLPALSLRAEQVANAVRPAVVRVEVGHEEFGSGVIFAPQGFVLTNQHVVDGSDRVTVVLPDGRRLKGEVLGSDSTVDVAVIRVDAGNLPMLTLGDSSLVQQGDEVVVLGYTPLWRELPSARTGIVRFVGAIRAHGFHWESIDTDAFVHPGDSGGPILNLRGEVIGLTEAMMAPRGSRGSLLANGIPSNTVLSAVDNILDLP